jgi:poly(A) polymerase
MLSVDDGRALLNTVLTEDDPRPGLWELVDSGFADHFIPELTALKLEQDPIHKHKDVLAHTIAVTGQTRADLTLRMAALFHDIAKPQTRKIDADGVTFRHHEAVGAKMVRARLRELGYEERFLLDVKELVRLSGRFKGFADGWSDSAVRRYARDAGHLLGLLNELVRADCTTRHEYKRVELHSHVDEIEARILKLAEEDRIAAERPLIDGDAVMARFDIKPGRQVGEAMKWLLALKRREPDLDLAGTEARLDQWWADQQ